jgi:hypothetical protein
MKTLSISILVLLQLTMSITNAVADEKKSTMKTEQAQLAEQQAINSIENMEPVRIDMAEQPKVKIFDHKDQLVYSGNCQEKEAVVLKLKSDYLVEIDGTCYYRLSR